MCVCRHPVGLLKCSISYNKAKIDDICNFTHAENTAKFLEVANNKVEGNEVEKNKY